MKYSPRLYIKGIFYFFEVMLYRLLNKSSRSVWLFSESKDEAKDNAFVLFEYVKNNHKNIEAYYVIDSSTANINEISRLDALGGRVEYGSFQHKKIFARAGFLISTHSRGMIEPWPLPLLKRVLKRWYMQKKFVFLTHGITQNKVSDILGKNTPSGDFDLFICGARPEYDFVLNNFGYDSKVVKLTGHPRFDRLTRLGPKVPQKHILLMPTWRSWIKEKNRLMSNSEFMETEYFSAIQSLINNEELIYFLEKNRTKLILLPHFLMDKLAQNFHSKSGAIEILNKDQDVDQLIVDSRALITDYSSIAFYAGYLKKPVIYYQFDRERFFNEHYREGYFNFNIDGFGPVCTLEEQVVNHIIEEDIQNKSKFFSAGRDKSCPKVYREIVDL